MELLPAFEAQLTADDLADLARAKRALEREPLAMKLAGAVGAPIERLIMRLPEAAHESVAEATRRALDRCLQAALASFGSANETTARKSRDVWHKLAVATTGAAGGAFGFVALPAELPLTTTLMFRSICDVARSEGEDLSALETRLQCLAVFGLGGGALRRYERSADDEADFGYFITRGALAQAISKASTGVTAKGVASQGTPALMKLINTIAARFSVQVSEQVAAKSIPVLGAALGAVVNTVFIDHFQQTAHGHFAIRRLERRYGRDAILTAYQAIELSPLA
jgi:hypothetical protein